jgi:hypothetical protein
VPDYSTLCRRQSTLLVAIPYRGSPGPLYLLIASHGFLANHCRAVGGSKRRLWRKINIHCPTGASSRCCREGGGDEETLEIRAIEVTSSSIGDAPMLPGLLSQIAPVQESGNVTADGAYDTRKCHDAIAARNAHAVIPPRTYAKLWRPPFHACEHAPPGNGHVPGPRHETKRSDAQNIWAVHCGGN